MTSPNRRDRVTVTKSEDNKTRGEKDSMRKSWKQHRVTSCFTWAQSWASRALKIFGQAYCLWFRKSFSKQWENVGEGLVKTAKHRGLIGPMCTLHPQPRECRHKHSRRMLNTEQKLCKLPCFKAAGGSTAWAHWIKKNVGLAFIILNRISISYTNTVLTDVISEIRDNTAKSNSDEENLAIRQVVNRPTVYPDYLSHFIWG